MISCRKIETLRDNLRPPYRPLQRLKLGPHELPQRFGFSDHHVVYGWPIIKWGFSMLQNRLETIFWCEKTRPEVTGNDQKWHLQSKFNFLLILNFCLVVLFWYLENVTSIFHNKYTWDIFFSMYRVQKLNL